MDYTQLFRKLREEKDLTLEQLAELAGMHRNTVVNIEAGRPVKFKTIAALMGQMGYGANSPELKSMALLWLESVSGIPFSRSETQAAARKLISSYRSSVRQAVQRLEKEVTAANLDAAQIGHLIFAARNPELISIIENLRTLTTRLTAPQPARELLAAEDAADYEEE
jgi:Predicted transcriptional regulators